MRGEAGLIRKRGERKGFVTSTWGPMGFKIFTVVPLQALFETQKQVSGDFKKQYLKTIF